MLPDTAENNQMIDVLDLTIKNHLESKFCDAKMANIDFEVKLRKFGGYAEFEGFVHQLEIFVPNLLKEIFTYSLNKTDLEVFIDLYQKNLKSYHSGYPYRVGLKVAQQFFEKNFSYPVNSEYLKLSDVIFSFFSNLITRWFKIKYECYYNQKIDIFFSELFLLRTDAQSCTKLFFYIPVIHSTFNKKIFNFT